MGHALRNDEFISPDEYLAGEVHAEDKHEYLDGTVHMMAGASIGHDRIAGNIYRIIGNKLAGHPCEVFTSDVKVRVKPGKAEFYYYPDVTVDCSTQRNSSLYAESPRVIFEVLSPDTERVDRCEKRLNYQTLPSLEVYCLVDQFRVAVTVYRRTESGWTQDFFADKANVIPIPSIGCELSVAAIYERTGL
jgi:Uma2 family endonuclease